jgi:O-acetylserine/cysteine efflux transporter
MGTRDLFAASIVIVFWGLNFVLISQGLQEFTPLQLGVGRFALTAFPLILLIARPAVPWRYLVLYSLLQGFGQFVLLFLALQVGMSSALASVIAQVQPFFTALFAVIWLKERWGFSLRVGFAVAAVGLACFLVQAMQPDHTQSVTLLGILFSLGAAASWAASNIVVRRLAAEGYRYDALGLVVWGAAVSAVFFLIASLTFDDPETRANWTLATSTGWISIVYQAWGATLIGYGLWTVLLKRYPASRVGPFSMGVPVIGVFAGMVWLGDTVTTLQWVGTALILAALAIVFAGARIEERATLRRRH